MRLVEAATDNDQIQKIARRWQGQFGDDGHIAEGPASRFKWRYEANYPIARIADKREIRAYFERHREDGKPEYYDSFNKPISEPVVLVEIGNISYLWDGNHRIAACLLTDRHTVPAYVGSLRNSNQIWGPREK